jgi:hypothetical protein
MAVGRRSVDVRRLRGGCCHRVVSLAAVKAQSHHSSTFAGDTTVESDEAFAVTLPPPAPGRVIGTSLGGGL